MSIPLLIDPDISSKPYLNIYCPSMTSYIINGQQGGNFGDTLKVNDLVIGGTVSGFPTIGPTGPKGPDGFNVGPTGPKGNTGIAGLTGDKGHTGINAANGDKGPTGHAGSTGGSISGGTGPTGLKGPTGAIGSIGNMGHAGATGATGDSVPAPILGTWTPELFVGSDPTGVTYAIQQGSFSKNGKCVYFNFTIALTNKGPNNNSLSIKGLPFNGAPIPQYSFIPLFAESINFAPNYSKIGLNIVAGTTFLIQFGTDSSKGLKVLFSPDINNNSFITGNGYFFTDS